MRKVFICLALLTVAVSCQDAPKEVPVIDNSPIKGMKWVKSRIDTISGMAYLITFHDSHLFSITNLTKDSLEVHKLLGKKK